MRWPWQRRQDDIENRSSGAGYTAAVMAAREAYISGSSGLAELTGTVQTCVSLWEGGIGLADVDGTDLLTPPVLARTARALALRGEALWLVDDTGLLPASDWEVSTRAGGEPRAYRLTLPDAGGGSTRTVLAGEVLHFRTGVDMSIPWVGSAPLRRARLTAGLLNALETALGEVYEVAPLGSTIVPMPEMAEAETERLSRSFRGNRGRVLIRESTSVSAAGGPGPAPTMDWRPSDLTPDLERAMTTQSLGAARSGILAAFGVLPCLVQEGAQGPAIREAQRHLAQFVLQPMLAIMAVEASVKLAGPVTLDCVRALQAFDAGGRARAFKTMVEAMVAAKAADIEGQTVEDALSFIDWAD